MHREVIPALELARMRYERAKRKHKLVRLRHAHDPDGAVEALIDADAAERQALDQLVKLRMASGEPPACSPCQDEPQSWFR